MKINLEVKRQEKEWFAWFPVRMEDNRFVWLEKVRRIPIYADVFFQYYIYLSIKENK